MSGKTKNSPESTSGAVAAAADPSNTRVAATFPSNSNSNNNDRDTGINPLVRVPNIREEDNTTPTFSGIQHRYDTTHMDYRIAQAWISSAFATTPTAGPSPNTETESKNQSSQNYNHSGDHTNGGEKQKEELEEFQDEFTESGEGERRHKNKNDATFHPLDGLRKSLFSYPSTGVQQQQQQHQEGDQEVQRDDGIELRLGWCCDNEEGNHTIVEEDNNRDAWLALLPKEDDLDQENELGGCDTSSMPGTPPSIPDNLMMDLSFNKINNSGDNEDGKILPFRHSYGPNFIPHNHNEENNNEEKDDPNSDGNDCSSFKAVTSPGDTQESPFSWMRKPQSWIPDYIIFDDDQRASIEDELLTGDGEKYDDQDPNETRLFRPPTLGASSRPTPIQPDDRQLTPQSWHTPISKRPTKGAYRNTSGGSRRTRGSVPLSPGSRLSGRTSAAKSEKYYHSYKTNSTSPPRPVPPFVVVHSAGSAVVKVTPKRTTLLPSAKTKPRRKTSFLDLFLPKEKHSETNCECGSTNTSMKTWCRKWGRPVTIALAATIFVLAIVTVVTGLVASRNHDKQPQQLQPQIQETTDTLRRRDPSLIPTESPLVSLPNEFTASEAAANPNIGSTDNGLVLDADRNETNGNLDVLWEGVVKRPYEETQNLNFSRPTLRPRTHSPSSSPYEEIAMPTFAPTMLPENFPDFVPTNLPFLLPRTQEPSSGMELNIDDVTPLQIPWNNYVIGLLSVESPNTFAQLDDARSPQYLALQWISVDSSRKSIAYTMDAGLQRYALATVYFALGGGADTDSVASWLDHDSWLSTVVNVCDWYGITCDDSRTAVLSLDLAENGLSGTLPEELNLLKYLQTLKFPRNSIVGTLPPEYSTLEELVELNLAENLLTGSLPKEYGGFGSFDLLKILDVSQNNLQGSISSVLGDMPCLEIVNMCSNSMTGNIPSALGSLSELKSLKLGNNLFFGDIPEAICDLETLAGPLSDVVVDCNVGCECCTRCCGDDDDSNKCC